MRDISLTQSPNRSRLSASEAEVQARATREKTARLKALRLAKEAQVQTEAPLVKQTNTAHGKRELNN